MIIIVLIVKFFEKVLKLSHNFTTPHDLLLFSISILSICIGYYLINRKINNLKIRTVVKLLY